MDPHGLGTSPIPISPTPLRSSISIIYYARLHWWDEARQLYSHPEAEQRRWAMIHQDLLEEGKIEELVAALRAIDGSTPEVAEKIRGEAGYFDNQKERMRYCRSRKLDLTSPPNGGLFWKLLQNQEDPPKTFDSKPAPT